MTAMDPGHTNVIVHSERVGYGVVKGKDGYAAVSVPGQEDPLTVPEIQALLLKEVAKVIHETYGFKVRDVVITVPAYFTSSQRRETLKAAELADLKVLAMPSGPAAAAIAYRYTTELRKLRQSPKEVLDSFGVHVKRDGEIDLDGMKEIVTVDLGGGTADVTAGVYGSGFFGVQALKGNCFLGGDDLTDAIYRRVLEIFTVSDSIICLQFSVVNYSLTFCSLNCRKLTICTRLS